jgi:hypothetical protein
MTILRRVEVILARGNDQSRIEDEDENQREVGHMMASHHDLIDSLSVPTKRFDAEVL